LNRAVYYFYNKCEHNYGVIQFPCSQNRVVGIGIERHRGWTDDSSLCGAENAAPSQKSHSREVLFITNCVYIYIVARITTTNHILCQRGERAERKNFLYRARVYIRKQSSQRQRGIEPLSFSARSVCEIWKFELRSPRFLWHQHIANHYFLLFARALFGFISLIFPSLFLGRVPLLAPWFMQLSFSGCRGSASAVFHQMEKAEN